MKYLLALIFLPLFTVAQINQVNPQGPAFDLFTDAYRFQDGSAMLATGGPFVVKVNDLTDADWQYGAHSVIYTDSFEVYSFEVLTSQIWSSGPYFTRDGGQSFSNLHDSSDSLSYFLNGQDWAVIDKHRQLHFTSDAGNSWQTATDSSWSFLNRSDTTLVFLRLSDTTLFQFHSDTLNYVCKWPDIYSGLQDFTWFHQIDTNLYMFEQQYRPFFYQTTVDSTWLDQNNYFTAPPTRFFVEGRRLIRQTATGTFNIYSNNTGGWSQTNVGYNGPAFAYSHNYLFYNSYLPDTAYAEGNLGIYKLGGGDATLLGFNAHPHSAAVYATRSASHLYGVQCCRFNGNGEIIDSNAHQNVKHITFHPNVFEDYGIGSQSLYSSTNYGNSWSQEKAVSDFLNSSMGGSFVDLQFSSDGQCLKSHIIDNQGQQHLGNFELSSGNATSAFLDQAVPSMFVNEVLSDFAFEDCQTGVIIMQGVPLFTGNGGQSFQMDTSLFSVGAFYSVEYFDNEFIASAQSGVWRSPDGSSWTQSPNSSFETEIDMVLNKNTFLGLEGYHLFITTDGGYNTRKIVLPFSPSSHIDKLNATSVVMSGPGGQLYLVSNADQLNISAPEFLESDMEMSYFPNPATDFFTVEFAREVKASLSLYTIDGRQALHLEQAKTTALEVPVSEIEPGLYTVKVNFQQKVHSFRLIVL